MKDTWRKLLTESRARGTEKIHDLDGRTAFDNDYSRIINSTAMRRLQDKAQVFPLKEGDFVRSRLTHSMEVSHFGHSMGLSITKGLIEKKILEEIVDTGKISGILSTAGIVHDFGNPPFGHFGETIIKSYFNNFFKKLGYEDSYQEFEFDLKNKQIRKKISEKLEEGVHILTKAEIEDLCSYDGNAQTFRILSKLHYLKDENSFNLTYPTLSVVVKYPRLSKDQKKGKFGYFLTEQKEYDKIKEDLKLEGRHPITFLLEAADDIAYSVADIEDGVKKRIFNSSYIKKCLEEYLSNIVNKNILKEEYLKKYGIKVEKKSEVNKYFENADKELKDQYEKTLKEIEEIEKTINEEELEAKGYFGYFTDEKKKFEEIIQDKTEETKAWFLLKKAILLLKYLKDKNLYLNLDDIKLQEFRIFLQGNMMIETQKYFLEKLENITKFELEERNILEESGAKYLRFAIKEVAKKIFSYSEIIEAEILGHKVLNTILDEMVNCVLSDNRTDGRTYEGKLYSLISYNYKFLNLELSPYKEKNKENPHVYDRLRMVIDFVSGMTDTYALKLYKKLILK